MSAALNRLRTGRPAQLAAVLAHDDSRPVSLDELDEQWEQTVGAGEEDWY